MKRTGFVITICCTLMVIATMGTTAIAGKTQSSVMTKKADGTYGKVEKVEALKNQETPKYFAQVKNAILSKWNGQKVAKAAKMKVDGVTGATMSSDAVKENVKRGLEYYQKNK